MVYTGFSLSATTAIIGVSIVLAIEIIVSTTIPTITDVHDSYDEMRDRSIDRLQTDINITGVNTPSNGSNYDLNVTIKNTGSITLEPADFTLLINGSSKKFTYTSTYFFPENTANLIVYNQPGSGTRRLKVVTNNGISDYYIYTIT